MEKVVYILGAGFSRPFDLPLMSDFINKAHDMAQGENEQYNIVLNGIEMLRASSKKYFKVNANNIEDMLSIAYTNNYINCNN